MIKRLILRIKMAPILFLILLFTIVNCQRGSNSEPTTITVFEGGNVTLPCEIPRNFARSQVLWMHSNGYRPKPIYHALYKINSCEIGCNLNMTSRNQFDISIVNISNLREGTFECTHIANPTTTVLARYNLRVVRKLVPSPIRRQITANRGANVTMECKIPLYINESDVYWRRITDTGVKYSNSFCRSNCNFNTTEKNQLDFTIINVTNSRAGIYECYLNSSVYSGALYHYNFDISRKNRTLATTRLPSRRNRLKIPQ